MRISLCVSVPPEGESLLWLFMESAARTASGQHEITVDFTSHCEVQRLGLLNQKYPLPWGHSYITEKEPPAYMHAGSVTHSRCVNALFQGADGDIAVISDFDIAFTQKNWDEWLIDQLKTNAFVGVPYSSSAGLAFNLTQVKVVTLKYQKKPNCIFIAFKPCDIKSITNKICTFAEEFRDPKSLPLMMVCTPLESRTMGMPIGSFIHLDTGNQIPILIERHDLAYHSLSRRITNYRVLKSFNPPKDYHLARMSEEYFNEDGPFVVHMRKAASRKMLSLKLGPSQPEIYTEEMFIADVRDWNDDQMRVAA